MGLKVNFAKVMILGAVAAGIVAALENFIQPGSGGSLLLSMTVWLGMAEGCIALMAAAELCHASWHKPIMRHMLSAQYMIPVIGLFFLVETMQLDVYPWIDESGLWLNKSFFIVRHITMFAIMFLLARRFTSLVLQDNKRNRNWAVVYILLFVIHQSMVGFEWVMSLEKPWFSTLLGAWFMVSAWQSGICAGAVLLYTQRHRFDDGLRYAQLSIGSLMFGFAVFWIYFYFSQLIVIWYGNLPEEVSYLAKRIGRHTDYYYFARIILGMCWLIPFTVLLRHKNKVIPKVTTGLAFIIVTGFVLEKYLMIHPALAVHPVLAIVEILMMGFIFVSVMKSSDELIPARTPEEPGSYQAAPQH
jgi:hypothetical protein